MGSCLKAANVILLHANIIVVMVGGAGVATAARLKWDPSTYIVVRELFPHEYRVAAVVLAANSFALIVLAHLAVSSTHVSPRPRRILLYLYAGVMFAVLCAEVSFMVWTALRIQQWLDTQAAQDLQSALEIRHQLGPLLEALGRWHPLPDKVKTLIEEAEADAPRNMYAALAGVLLLLVTQTTCVASALLSARGARLSAPRRRYYSQSLESSGSCDDRRPLKAIYRNGRLVMA